MASAVRGVRLASAASVVLAMLLLSCSPAHHLRTVIFMYSMAMRISRRGDMVSAPLTIHYLSYACLLIRRSVVLRNASTHHPAVSASFMLSPHDTRTQLAKGSQHQASPIICVFIHAPLSCIPKRPCIHQGSACISPTNAHRYLFPTCQLSICVLYAGTTRAIIRAYVPSVMPCYRRIPRHASSPHARHL